MLKIWGDHVSPGYVYEGYVMVVDQHYKQAGKVRQLSDIRF